MVREKAVAQKVLRAIEGLPRAGVPEGVVCSGLAEEADWALRMPVRFSGSQWSRVFEGFEEFAGEGEAGFGPGGVVVRGGRSW